MESTSLFKLSGLPDPFGAVLLSFSFILLLAPYFSGMDFGLLKVPEVTDSAKKNLRIIGPLMLLIVVLSFLPLIRIADRDANKEPNGVAADKDSSSKPNATKQITNPVGIQLVWIPSGNFFMGSTEAEILQAYENDKIYDPHPLEEWFKREFPRHQVRLCEGFYMSRFEITQKQWQTVMGSNKTDFTRGDIPVTDVSWDDAQDFVQKLNAKNDGYTYSLPTEAQWEYACRAGGTAPFSFGDSLTSQQANFDGRFPFGTSTTGPTRNQTMPVGSFPPNEWGLYDMHGNVSEWCQDSWHANYEGDPPPDCAEWTHGGDPIKRVLRGGSWSLKAVSCRCASRLRDAETTKSTDYGFRVTAVPGH